MLRKVVIASSYYALARGILAVGASGILSLRGERTGLLRLGLSPSDGPELTLPVWQSAEHAVAQARSWRYCGEPEVELTLVDWALGADFSFSQLPKVLEESLPSVFEGADCWLCEWRLPMEYLDASTSQSFDEVWCLHPALEIAAPRAVGSKWVNIPIIPARPAAFPDHGLVLEQDAPMMLDQSPFVFATPGSQNAIAVAELVQERCRP